MNYEKEKELLWDVIKKHGVTWCCTSWAISVSRPVFKKYILTSFDHTLERWLYSENKKNCLLLFPKVTAQLFAAAISGRMKLALHGWSIYVSLYLSTYLSFYLSSYSSIYSFIFLSICHLSVHLFICSPVDPSLTYLSTPFLGAAMNSLYC